MAAGRRLLFMARLIDHNVVRNEGGGESGLGAMESPATCGNSGRLFPEIPRLMEAPPPPHRQSRRAPTCRAEIPPRSTPPPPRREQRRAAGLSARRAQ